MDASIGMTWTASRLKAAIEAIMLASFGIPLLAFASFGAVATVAEPSGTDGDAIAGLLGIAACALVFVAGGVDAVAQLFVPDTIRLDASGLTLLRRRRTRSYRWSAIGEPEIVSSGRSGERRVRLPVAGGRALDLRIERYPVSAEDFVTTLAALRGGGNAAVPTPGSLRAYRWLALPAALATFALLVVWPALLLRGG